MAIWELAESYAPNKPLLVAAEAVEALNAIVSAADTSAGAKLYAQWALHEIGLGGM